MIKINLKCWWTSDESLKYRFVKQFVTDYDLERYEFVSNNQDFTIVFGRTDWEQIKTPKDKTFYFSQEPLWSPNEPKKDIENYCSKIFIADKSMYPNKSEYIEDLFPMFYGAGGENDHNPNYSWDLSIKDRHFAKNKNISVVVKKDYYTHYNHLEKPNIFKINFTTRTKLAEKLSEENKVDIGGINWQNNNKNILGTIWNKHVALNDYKFSIGCENTIQKNYISEKFWDIVLTDGVPIYLGCNNIEKHIPNDSFISLNNLTIDEMIYNINNIYENSDDIYNQYKSKILNLKQEFFTNKKYNLWEKIKFEMNE